MTEETVEESFARFWELYPRRIAKRAAVKAFEKAAKEDEVVDIMSGLHAFVKDCHGKEAKFIPHPATWLNAGRYFDEAYIRQETRAEAPKVKLQGQAWADTVMASDAGQRAIKEGLANDMYCWAIKNPGEYPDEHLFQTFAADADYCRKAVAHEMEPGRNQFAPLLASFYRNFKSNEESLARLYGRD